MHKVEMKTLSLRPPLAGFIVFVIFHEFGLISATQTAFASPFNPLGELRTLSPAPIIHSFTRARPATIDARRKKTIFDVQRLRMHRLVRLEGRQLKFFVSVRIETIVSSAQTKVLFFNVSI